MPEEVPPSLKAAAAQAARGRPLAPGTETERPHTDDHDAVKGAGNGSRANPLKRYGETVKRPVGAGASEGHCR